MSTAATPEARDRLLQAWLGEIVAGRMYELIARRLPEREAGILRRMSAAEAGHRGRIEGRMRELGIGIPPESGVRISTWMRYMRSRVSSPISSLRVALGASARSLTLDMK